jgi:hypothetical protein
MLAASVVPGIAGLSVLVPLVRRRLCPDTEARSGAGCMGSAVRGHIPAYIAQQRDRLAG